MGRSPGFAPLIPGHGARGRDGVHQISAACLGLIREAERIAGVTAIDAVVFSGWTPNGGPSEAEQMRSAWRGPEVELVVEPTASVTAENATRTLPLLIERGIQRAVVVCAPFHLYRARFFFTRLFDPYGVETEFRVAQTPPSVGAILWEVAAATAARRQLRTAKRELAQVVR